MPRRLLPPFALLVLVLMQLPLAAQPVNPEDIRIARDQWGVPHIFAPTDAGVAYGLAWAHAEDDFEHMQHALLNAQGRLGEVLGKEGAILDFLLHFTGADTLVDARYEQDLSPAYRRVVEAYTAGVNAYAEAHPKEVLLKDAFPIRPKDVVTGYMIPLSLMAGLGKAFEAVNEGKVSSMLTPNYRRSSPHLPAMGSGSNGMAIAPSRTASGETFLLINSHQPMEGRFSWYEAHLHSEEGLNILGGLFPGGTNVFSGTNEHLGWAHTNNYSNWGDVYKLRIHPEDDNKYFLDGEWREFQTREVTVKAKLFWFIKWPVKRTIRTSVFGPVFEGENGTYAFRFPAFKDIRAAEQWYRMCRAANFEEFKAALKMQAFPMFNVVYADRKGNIFFGSLGKYPKRDTSLDWQPPVDGTNSRYKWTELLPWADYPKVENPSCGYVFNANNTPLVATCPEENWSGRRFPGLQTFMYNRGDRFRELFAELEGQKITWEDFKRIKYDDCLAENGRYRRNFRVFQDLDSRVHPELADAIKHYQAWDGCSGKENSHAAFGMVTHHFLSEVTDFRFAMLMIRQDTVRQADALAALRKAKAWMMKHHGRLDVPHGEVLRHKRGEKSLPIGGHREVLRAMHTKPDPDKKGQFLTKGGDCYFQLVRFTNDGPVIRSINAYGASADPESPHYTDQMKRFANRQTKAMTLDKADILQHAERVYLPVAGTPRP